MLRREFDNLAISTDPDKAVEDFEAHCPAVLVLAFTSLAKAQAYYLGLYRLSTQAHTMAHRTVILCSKGELEQVYALCKKGYYSKSCSGPWATIRHGWPWKFTMPWSK